MASGSGSSIREGINRTENHDRIEKQTRELIDLAAQQGVQNIILLTGERRGMSDQQGLDNCVAFLNKIKAQAEDKGVTLCTELLNSKVDHPDYMCDRTAWGVEMCKRVNSPRVKLLYDIYHMQIMEGDIIRTIRNNIQYIGHFHTAGNPGRHEMDDTQEMNYRGIARAIADLGFTGYVAHEYTPVRDPLKSLDETLALFEV
jgi:hydroxypyruvate isomerase